MSTNPATVNVQALRTVELDAAPPEAATPAPAPAAAPAPAPKRKKAPLFFGVLVGLAAAGAGAFYWYSLGKESTDDAQVEAHVGFVAARIGGQVTRVLVEDDQPVKAGQILLELDDADYVTKLASARADLAAAQATEHSAEAQLELTRKQVDANLAIARGGVAQASAVSGSTQAQIDQAVADVKAAESRAQLAHLELGRAQKLGAQGAVPQAEVDVKQTAADAADAGLVQSRARVVTAETGRQSSSGTTLAAQGHLLVAQTAPQQVAAAQAQVELAVAKVAQAESAVHQAELQLGYTKLRAEMDGVVAKRNVEPGQMVSPDRPVMSLVASTPPWIVANFKETQLAHIKPGQHVRVKVDGLDGGALDGTVASIQSGTGSRFSLLPPDNASGNFTKVTQRVPVKIELASSSTPLRPGMSADVTVYTE